MVFWRAFTFVSLSEDTVLNKYENGLEKALLFTTVSAHRRADKFQLSSRPLAPSGQKASEHFRPKGLSVSTRILPPPQRASCPILLLVRTKSVRNSVFNFWR
mmetsp:Transcript_26861/g.104246  ORF Transcript_26861/g.104246 Transcript_26861/m.104246 type:complete len:102 (+) Transcript_26861:2068-2373(+)